MNIAILGAGSIAAVLAETMNKMKDISLYAVASRDINKAEAFAKKYGVKKAYGSYEDMLKDERVELVYIATPHSHHYEHMMLSIDYGKHVLCEKAFTVNAKQTEDIINKANERGVYVAEAIWTRYMPSRLIIDDLLDSGIIGNVKTLTANLSYVIDKKERLIRPELAGGALLDVGIYCLNFMIMHFGKDIDRIETSVYMTDTGVDGQESISVFYKNGRMAVLNAGIYARSDRHGIFYGDKGYIVVDNINNPRRIEVYDTSDEIITHIECPEQISGYEYEIEEAVKSINEGRKESISMPLSETVYMMEMMDNIRNKWGLKYPQEL